MLSPIEKRSNKYMRCIQLHCAIEEVVDGAGLQRMGVVGLRGDADFYIGDEGLAVANTQFVVQQHFLLISVSITRPDDNNRDTTLQISPFLRRAVSSVQTPRHA